MSDDVYQSFVDITHQCFPGTAIVLQKAPGYVAIVTLVVEKSRRDRGIGTSIMMQLTELADKMGDTLATNTGGDARVEAFFEVFGFIRNRGRRADPTIPYGSIRRPRLVVDALESLPLPPAVELRVDVLSFPRPEEGLRAAQEATFVNALLMVAQSVAEKMHPGLPCYCLPATQLGIHISRYFGHTLKSSAVDFSALSKEYWDSHMGDAPTGLGVITRTEGKVTPTRYRGHVVGILNDRWMLEFSLKHFEAKAALAGLALPECLAIRASSADLAVGCGAQDPSNGAVLIYRANPNKDHCTMDAWRNPIRAHIAMAIRATRKTIADIDAKGGPASGLVMMAGL
jgi:hypothetical protein